MSGSSAARELPIAVDASRRLAHTLALSSVRWGLPAIGAAVSLRYLVPTPAEASRTWLLPLATLGEAHPLFVGVGLFAILGAVVQYWVRPPPASTVRQRSSDLGMALGVAIVGAMSLRAAIGLYKVESASMLPTLEPDETLGGLRAAFWGLARQKSSPARGDIVVFERPRELEGPALLVKRVVGLPGDRVSMKGVIPVINGKPVPVCEAGPYLYPLPGGGAAAGRVFVEFLGDRPHLAIYAAGVESWTGTYEVRPGEVFVLGDNRGSSTDSRSLNAGKGGGIPVVSIDARVSRRLLSPGRDGHVDPKRSLRPLELDASVDGIDTSFLLDGIRSCLQHPPAAR